MTEMLFYHLQRQPIERVLPPLIEKSIERGWRVVVQTANEERVDALDAHLWTYRDDAFLAHGTYRDNEAALQPVLLTVQSLAGMKAETTIGPHRVIFDAPKEAGGGDEGPSPAEMLLGAIGA